MEHMNMSYTKPMYTLAAADPVKQQQFVEETFPALKKMVDGREPLRWDKVLVIRRSVGVG
jgi:hypothetical protein